MPSDLFQGMQQPSRAMRISYFLVADAMNETDDGRFNLLGVGWSAKTATALGQKYPMAIAFGAEGVEEDLRPWQILLQLNEPSGRQTSLIDTTYEATRSDGPPGIPPVSFAGRLFGELEVEAAGVHRLTLDVGEAHSEVTFVVYVQPPKEQATKRKTSKSVRRKTEVASPT